MTIENEQEISPAYEDAVESGKIISQALRMLEHHGNIVVTVKQHPLFVLMKMADIEKQLKILNGEANRWGALDTPEENKLNELLKVPFINRVNDMLSAKNELFAMLLDELTAENKTKEV